MAALGSALMLVSYFPYLTYAVPCIAGLVSAVTAIEIDERRAYAVYVVSAIITLLFAEPEAKLLYIMFFGYYPVLKIAIERIKIRPLEIAVKFAVFNAAIIIAYSLFAGLFGVDMSDMGDFGKYTAYILLLAGNAVFFIYDIMIERLAMVYMKKLHRTVEKLIMR